MSQRPRAKYRLLEHTADLKVEIYGKDLLELFANAAFMLFDVMVDTGQVRERMREEVEIFSTDLNELFLDWLRELLYRFATKGFITKRVEVKVEVQPVHLCGTLYGESYEPKRHGLKIEIKTPTYHQFQLQEEKGNFKATVVFDV